MTTKPILLVIVFVLSLNANIFAQETDSDAINVQDINITFEDDYVTVGRLTLPTNTEAPYPTVILYHGSGAWDMNATYLAPDGTLLSENFALISETLAEAGYAVISYNKRGVLGNGEYDTSQAQAASSLAVLIQDGQSVLDFAMEQADIDAKAIYLYGWSEGAWVASHLAANNPDTVAGIILQGAPNQTLAEALVYQHIELGLPYLADEIDANSDGGIDIEESFTIPTGSVQLMNTFYIWGRDYDPENPSVNWFVDSNSDSVLDIESELRPIVEQTIDMFAGFDDGISRVISDILADSEQAVLLLHGDTDGYVQVSQSEAIAEALPDTSTFIIYEGLGHALDVTERPEEDAFGMMAEAPLTDMITWLNEQ